MRMARWKADKNQEKAHYHCISRVVDRRFVLGPDEREKFIRIMRGYEAFCGVRVVTFCIMSNHFHLLVEEPRRPSPEMLPSKEEPVVPLRKAGCPSPVATLEQTLARFRKPGFDDAAEKLREHFFARMWDYSFSS